MAVSKSADDKRKRLNLLEDLQKSTRLGNGQKKWLREELVRTRKGIQGESESAYYLDQYFKHGENHVLLHDLRLVLDADVAQIDHLVFNRLGHIYMIETKNYAGSVSINDFGEFTVDYDGDRFGVPSPIEQSRRHEGVLRRMLERLDIKPRIGGGFEFHHVVLFHPKAIIHRPAAKTFDSSNVIKADQFPSWHDRFVQKEVGAATLLLGAANLRSLETIREWGEKLKRQHRPFDPLALPEFMRPGEETPRAAPVAARLNGAATKEVTKVVMTSAAPAGAKRLICLQCNAKITFAEGKFCWNNVARFNGGQYCREHQAMF